MLGSHILKIPYKTVQLSQSIVTHRPNDNEYDHVPIAHLAYFRTNQVSRHVIYISLRPDVHPLRLVPFLLFCIFFLLVPPSFSSTTSISTKSSSQDCVRLSDEPSSHELLTHAALSRPHGLYPLSSSVYDLASGRRRVEPCG